jgi:hypothetical protein
MKIALYARASTARPVDRGSYESQFEYLQACNERCRGF